MCFVCDFNRRCSYLLSKLIIMKKNMGTLDRSIRLAVALIIAVLFYMGILPSTIGVILLVIAAVFVLTSFVSFCPLYSLVGLNTCKVKNN